MNKEEVLKAFKVGSMNINGFDVGTVIRDLYAQLDDSDPKGSFNKCMEAMADRDAAHTREDKLRERLAAAENVVEVARTIDKEAFAKGTQNVDIGRFRSLDYALRRFDELPK